MWGPWRSIGPSGGLWSAGGHLNRPRQALRPGLGPRTRPECHQILCPWHHPPSISALLRSGVLRGWQPSPRRSASFHYPPLSSSSSIAA